MLPSISLSKSTSKPVDRSRARQHQGEQQHSAEILHYTARTFWVLVRVVTVQMSAAGTCGLEIQPRDFVLSKRLGYRATDCWSRDERHSRRW